MAAKAKAGLLTEFPDLVPAKIGYYKNTPAGCTPDRTGGNVWNPTLGSGPLRMAMIPKDQPLSHAVMIVMRYWSLLPPDDELYFPPRSLWDYKGFVRSGSIQKKASPGQGIKSRQLRKSLDKNGTTLYDSSGDLMTIDGVTLRGCLGPDQKRKPGSVTEKNFQSQPNYAKWWHGIVHGVEIADPVQAKAYADAWLKRYAPRKMYDSTDLRYRRLSCEKRFNKDASKIANSPLETPTPVYSRGGYSSMSDTEDEDGVVTKKQKKAKVARKPKRVSEKPKPKRVPNVVDKPVDSDEEDDDDDDGEEAIIPKPNLVNLWRNQPSQSAGPKDGKKRKLLDPYDSEESGRKENPDQAIAPSEPVLASQSNAPTNNERENTGFDSDEERRLTAEANEIKEQKNAFAQREKELKQKQIQVAERRRLWEEEAQRAAEAERIEKQRLEAERIEKQRLEVERIEKQRLEAERIEKQRLEAERIEKQRLEAERIEKQRLEAEENQRIEMEKRQVAAERVQQELADQDKERYEQEQLDHVHRQQLLREGYIYKKESEQQRDNRTSGDTQEAEAEPDVQFLYRNESLEPHNGNHKHQSIKDEDEDDLTFAQLFQSNRYEEVPRFTQHEEARNRQQAIQPQNLPRPLNEAMKFPPPQPGVPLVRNSYNDLQTLLRHQTLPMGNPWSSNFLPRPRNVELPKIFVMGGIISAHDQLGKIVNASEQLKLSDIEEVQQQVRATFEGIDSRFEELKRKRGEKEGDDQPAAKRQA